MVVDNISHGFKIFLLHTYDTEVLDDPLGLNLNDPLMLVYDSATNEWQHLRSSPFRIRPGKVTASSAMFQGSLYVYLRYSPLGDEHPLWRYNLVEDAWENLTLAIADELPKSQLIVSANRLFLVAWSTGGLDYDHERPWSFQVSELNFISDATNIMTREVLFEISRADVVGGVDLKTGIENPLSNMLPGISVIGFGNSLLFMSKSTGISAAFDLVTRCWDHGFPRNPLEYLPDERCLWKQMNLLLPCTLW